MIILGKDELFIILGYIYIILHFIETRTYIEVKYIEIWPDSEI